MSPVGFCVTTFQHGEVESSEAMHYVMIAILSMETSKTVMGIQFVAIHVPAI